MAERVAILRMAPASIIRNYGRRYEQLITWTEGTVKRSLSYARIIILAPSLINSPGTNGGGGYWRYSPAMIELAVLLLR